MTYLWSYIKRYPVYLVLNFIGILSSVIAMLGLPTAFARMIDEAIIANNPNRIYYWMFIMLAIVLIAVIGRSMAVYMSSQISTGMIREVRQDLFAHIQEYSNQNFEDIGIPSLITRVTNDAFVLMQFSDLFLRIGFMTPMMLLGSVILILTTAPSLAWIVAAAVPPLLLVMFFIGKRSRPLSEEQQASLDRINQFARENLTGLRVIRAFVREDYQEMRFNKETKNYADVTSKLFKLMGLINPMFFHIINWIIILIFVFALQPLETARMQIGTVIAFTEYAFHALFSILMFAQILVMYPRMNVSAKRLEEILALKPAIISHNDGITQTETQGYIEFNNVAFAYPGETENPVLQNINFTARPGETVAFIGSTGSGKSTLIRLIPRMFDVTFGSILIDGVDVRNYDLAALRDKIGFVPQKAVLFNGTIAENLRFGDAAGTEADFDRASEIAQASEFISGLELGYQSHISEGGSNLSGGQRQRLSIARAIMKDPAIYIFDDSFSALDFKTEASLRKSLKQITEDKTVLIVAQRISTIRDADRIIVLNEGEIVGQGTHDELMASNQIYQDIAASQNKSGKQLEEVEA